MRLRIPLRRRIILYFALVACLEFSIPLYVAATSEALLRGGTRVVLRAEPLDPRDVLRGEYSRLNYVIGRLHDASPTVDQAARCAADSDGCRVRSGGAVFVVLKAGPDGIHDVEAVSAAEPPAGTLFIAGKAGTGLSPGECPGCLTGLVTYGIETWYGPQGLPAFVDHAGGRLTIAVRVGPRGQAIVEAPLIDGQAPSFVAR